MLTNENSTGAAGDATDLTCAVSASMIEAISDKIDQNGGLITRARAVKHLTTILLEEFERQLSWHRGSPSNVDGIRHFAFTAGTLETMEWVLAEAWALAGDLSDQVDTLQNDFVPVANSAYDARKASTARAA